MDKYKGIGSLIAALHHFEPCNYAFGRVLKSGLLHALTHGYGDMQKFPTKQKLVREQLMLALCHIFVRVPICDGFNKNRLKKYLHQDFDNRTELILPDLMNQDNQYLRGIGYILQEHDSYALQTFVNYYKTFAVLENEKQQSNNSNNNNDTMTDESKNDNSYNSNECMDEMYLLPQSNAPVMPFTPVTSDGSSDKLKQKKEKQAENEQTNSLGLSVCLTVSV